MSATPPTPDEDVLLATAERLQARRERLADSTARLRMRAKRLERSTTRLRNATKRLEPPADE